MTPELVVPNTLAVLLFLALVGLGVAVAVLYAALQRSREETDALLARAAADAEHLREQLTDIEEQLQAQAAVVSQQLVTSDRAPVVVDDREFVITDMARERLLVPGMPSVPLPFVDTLLRESLVRTASLAAGLRHALAPEVRNRIRFEMRRDVKLSRRQRKIEQREVRRELRARQRAGIEPAG